MSISSKVGLLFGLGLVVLIAVLFYRKDPTTGKIDAEPTAATVKHTGTFPVTSPSPAENPKN